jgi:hypothetical protein
LIFFVHQQADKLNAILKPVKPIEYVPVSDEELGARMTSFQVPSFLTEFLIWLNRTHQGNADEKLYTQGNVGLGRRGWTILLRRIRRFGYCIRQLILPIPPPTILSLYILVI